jgi:hypothetical protein
MWKIQLLLDRLALCRHTSGMAKSPIKRLKAYGRGPRQLSELWDVENEYAYGTSDRAMAILMGAMLENVLESFILFHMNPDLSDDDTNRLTGPEGPIGTLSSKITLGFAFSLFGATTRHDLDLVRHVRNEFAHTLRPLDFTVSAVADVCAELEYCDLDGVETPSSYFQGAPDQKVARSMMNARTRYFTTCHEIASRMMRLYLGKSDLDAPLPPGSLLP